MANILRASTYTEQPLTDRQLLSYFPAGTTGTCVDREVMNSGRHHMRCDLRTPVCPPQGSVEESFPGSLLSECYPNKRYTPKHMRISLRLLPECDETECPPNSNLSTLIQNNRAWVKNVIKGAFQYDMGISTVYNIRVYPKSLKASLDISNKGTPPAVADLQESLDYWEDGKADGWMEGDIAFPSDERYILNMSMTGTKAIKAKRGKRRATRGRRR
jgi:hypothetical protein